MEESFLALEGAARRRFAEAAAGQATGCGANDRPALLLAALLTVPGVGTTSRTGTDFWAAAGRGVHRPFGRVAALAAGVPSMTPATDSAVATDRSRPHGRIPG